MKFSIAALTGFVGAIGAVSVPRNTNGTIPKTNATLPAAFTLVADGGRTVLTDGSNAYIGGNTTSQEILILRSGPNGAVSFTSKDASPTGFQSLYVVDKSVSPIGLTIPHGTNLPEGASTLGFGVNEKGYFTHNGLAWFAVDGYGSNPTKEIFWYGAHNAEYMGANLWVKECRGC